MVKNVYVKLFKFFKFIIYFLFSVLIGVDFGII